MEALIFIVGIIIIILIFVFYGFTMFWKCEPLVDHFENDFENGVGGELVPDNLKFYDRKIHNTSLIDIPTIKTGRFPIEIEVPVNWYNTQPFVPTVGTDTGKSSAECLC